MVKLFYVTFCPYEYCNIQFPLVVKDGVKPRATSLLASPSSGSEATPTSSSIDHRDSAGTPTGQWSAFSSGSKRQSKQARQVARQTELKRYRATFDFDSYIPLNNL